MKKDEITLKNTKAEILEALNAALEREKNASKTKSNPAKEIKEKAAKQAVASAKESVEKNIFSKELMDKFNDLELAIKTEEEKLNELYGVEKELNNLTLVVNTSKDLIQSLEQAKQEKEKALKEELSKLEQTNKTKIDEMVKAYNTKLNELKTAREREVEEYNYKINRERTIANNKWEDEKQAREQALKIKEEEINKLLSDAKENEKHLQELEKQVNDIPTLLTTETKKAVDTATKDLTKDHKYEIELLKKDYQNNIDRLSDKVSSLEDELNKAINEKNSLQEKLDKAYVQMKELAKTTVESSSAVRIIRDVQTDKQTA